MKKFTVLLALAAALVFATNSFAQGKWSAGLGVGYNLPMGDFSKASKGNAKAGLGFGVHFANMVSDNIQVGIGLGLVSFELKSSGRKYKMMPILLNGRYFFSSEKLAPYAGINLGMTSSKLEQTGVKTNSKMVLSYGLGAGVTYGLSDNMGLDFGLSYNAVNWKKTKFTIGGFPFSTGWNASFLGINLGLNYKF